MLPYVFRPFPKSGYIRTLALEPGAYDDDIVIHMSRVPFDPAHPPYYEALSYFWGSNTNKKPIYVGKQGGSIIMVTRNLEVALRHLRPRHGSSRIMWIDAICINQADDEEKGPQVAKMGQIFKHAARVTAWLGPEQNSSDQAMRLMGYLGSQVSLFDGSECRDSRDRIYAILDLLHDLDRRLNIQPDYTKSTASVYKCLTRMYIEKSRSVKILQDCQIDTNIKNTSWVPDWTAKLETEQFTTMFASSQLASDFVLRI
ncbi:hypothetical protein TruAng_011408 [Truncatella angustata]|nr:hypothetical protein TruAng_011408 [Truncatella angustata]